MMKNTLNFLLKVFSAPRQLKGQRLWPSLLDGRTCNDLIGLMLVMWPWGILRSLLRIIVAVLVYFTVLRSAWNLCRRSAIGSITQSSHGQREALGSSPCDSDSRSGHDFFLPCDIWWLSVGSRLGQRASKSACFVVPSRFGDESN